LVVGAVILVLLVISPSRGRATPTNNYRPLLPADALASGCFPLPGGARLDLPHQIRSDQDVLTSRGMRRELRGQYDLVDRDVAERRIVTAFRSAGFEESPRVLEDGAVTLTNPSAGSVTVSVTDLPGSDAGMLVRGSFVLDLPVSRPASTAEVCGEPASTKRWAS
jgi:hypothetical protein